MKTIIKSCLGGLGVSLFALSSAAADDVTELRDKLTVSGRYELPKAKTSLNGKLSVQSKMDLKSDLVKLAAKSSKVNEKEFEEALNLAFEKSLKNYGYLNVAGETPTHTISYDLKSIEFEETEDGTVANVEMDISAPEECLTATPQSKYVAIKIKDKQGDRKAFAFLGAIAITALNPYDAGNAGLFLGEQLTEASRLNKVSTYGEDIGIGEGYPTKRSKKGMQRYAFQNATRLNIARYMAIIDQGCK